MSESTKRSISRTKDQTDKSILHCANLHQTQWKMLFTPRYLLLCCAKAKKSIQQLNTSKQKICVANARKTF